MAVNGDSLKKLNNIDLNKLGADLHVEFNRGRRLSKANDAGERRVLVIYTGGTIGMVKTDDGLSPGKNMFKPSIRRYPQLHDENYHQKIMKASPADKSLENFFALPKTDDVTWRILYEIKEYDPLLDSSDMTEADWIKIAKDIQADYEQYDGFVVLHGTDTLSYTASALSFMFENLGKAVVLTGSQIPIFEPRSDGVDNFVSSLIIAGGYNIPEVTIFFYGKLLRGNRTRKISVNNLFAFDSPNAVPIVKVGLEMEVNKSAIFKPTVIEKFQVHAKMSKHVAHLRLFPSISTEAVKSACQHPIQGLVMETYGAGNVPATRHDILEVIEKAVKRGVIIVNITQCATGAVAALYKTGQMMCLNIRGELTNLSSMSIEDQTLKEALGISLNIQSPKKLAEVVANVFSSLLLYGIKKGDEGIVRKLLGKTPLHEAILTGNHEMVECLLMNGANVHFKTRTGECPLITAVLREDPQIINLLLKCGAHLASADIYPVVMPLPQCLLMIPIEGEGIVTNKFSISIANNITNFLQAVLCNRPEAAEFLLRQGVDKEAKDVLGHSPADYVLKLNRRSLVTYFH
ncbi:hypothetical protein HF086_013601 [Spodoptera exigua]|uniref:asparaginase n=1 Tax=Spodoptera exigua TaxID=7107 RepID=A0A922SMB4_SPOEX|nr:hypothetical protein HF086_013601 [Spodoptera exigua]